MFVYGVSCDPHLLLEKPCLLCKICNIKLRHKIEIYRRFWYTDTDSQTPSLKMKIPPPEAEQEVTTACSNIM